MPQPPNRNPSARPAARAPSRRLMLKAIAAAPLLVAAALPAVAAADELVLHEGWVLRADDLQRLGRS
ncbi:MAG: hypothetical protein P4M09_28420 [Devosia sp.]|nr:hypothetical protein [Devosia sp.]